MGIPLCSQNTVSVTALQTCGNGTLAFVDNDTVVFVHISQYIVTRNGVATFCHDIILLDILFRQFQDLLRIDFLLFLQWFFFNWFFVVLVTAEREGEKLLPVGSLFLFQGIFIQVAQYDLFIADGYQKLVPVFHIMGFHQLVYQQVVQSQFFFFEEFVQKCFAFFLAVPLLFAQDGGYLGTGTGSSGKYFPFRLYAL